MIDGSDFIGKIFIYGGVGFVLLIFLSILISYILCKGKRELIEYTRAERKYHKELHKNNINTNPDYIKVKQLFNQSMKQGLLKREGILKFKEHINTMLQNNIKHYSQFTFKNDCNEVYVKLKNSSFTKVDYIQLYDYLDKIITTTQRQ